MRKLLKDLGEAISWIWMTPSEARDLLRRRDVTFEIGDARRAYGKAA